MRITRRGLMAGIGAAGLAGSLGMRPARAEETADVIVIGAGISGLYTAWLLEQEGMKVVTLEASGRVGGRMHTLGEYDGLSLDVGATTVGSLYSRMRFMIETLGLEMDKMPGGGGMAYHINGQFVPNDAAWADSDANRTVGRERTIPPQQLEWAMLAGANPLKNIDDWFSPDFAEYDIPAGQFMKQNGVSDEAIRLINITSNVEDVWTSSALNSLRDITRFSVDQAQMQGEDRRGMFDFGLDVPTHIKGGSENLPRAVAAALQNEVRLNEAVASIRHEQGGSKVRVTTFGGKQYVGDFVVSAVPFHALRKVQIDPTPAAPQAQAIFETVYSATTQVMFAVKEKFWEEDGGEPGLITDTPLERIFARGTPSGDMILNVWMNGAGAELVDSVPEAEFVNWVQQELARLRPASAGKIEPITWYSWGRNPWVGGNRHVYNAGQVTRFANQISDPIGRIHIAGEHTRKLEPGMEAAMASGDRVLQEILERTG